MTSSTLAPPRPSTPPRPAAPRSTRPRPPANRQRELAQRRIWLLSVVGSVLVHLLLLWLSPLVVRVGPPPGDPDALDEPASSALRMVDPALIPAQSATATDASSEPEAMPRFVVPERAPARDAREPLPVGARPRGEPSPRDNPLRPGLRDPRLWVAPRELPPEPEPTHEELHARYMAQLEARLNALNDSIAGDAERARRTTDWTMRDKNGRRWGVSPDGIHLGGVTLPPVAFPAAGGDPDRRARAEEQGRARAEIERQEADRERRRVTAERSRATRERKDAERQNE